MTPEWTRRIPQVSDGYASEYLRLRRARKGRDVAALVESLGHPAWAGTASRFLGQIGARDAVPEVAVLLQADEPHIRMAAVEALGRLEARDPAGSVERLATGDSDQAGLMHWLPLLRSWAPMREARSRRRSTTIRTG